MGRSGWVLPTIAGWSTREWKRCLSRVSDGGRDLCGDGNGGVRTIDTSPMPGLVLRETEISENGTFLGTVEYEGSPDSEAGSFDGAFGGTGASDVAGVIWVNPIDGETGIHEYGTFNLPRCDLPGASPICTPRRP